MINDDLLSAIARGRQTNRFVDIMSQDDQPTIAMVTGRILSDVQGDSIKPLSGDRLPISSELIVHIDDGERSVSINLLTLLELAAAQCRYQRRIGKRASASITRHRYQAKKKKE